MLDICKSAPLPPQCGSNSTHAPIRLWHGLVTFGCAITIPDEEEELTKEFLTPALIAASLVNDLFSFEKEKNDANCQNAVYIVMKEHRCGEEEGRERIRQRIRIETANYVQIVKDTKLRTDISEEVKRYVDVMQYTLSGNVVWSAQCPRYNLKAQWTELQMLRAKHGVAKYPTMWPPADGSMDHLWKPKGEKRKRTDSVNGTNGVKKSAISKLSTESLKLTKVVSLALDSNLPDLSDHVSCAPYPDFCHTNSMPRRLQLTMYLRLSFNHMITLPPYPRRVSGTRPLTPSTSGSKHLQNRLQRSRKSSRCSTVHPSC